MHDDPTPLGSRRRRGALLALGIVSSALFLWLVLRGADLAGVRRALAEADPVGVVLAALVVQGVYVAQAARWRVISQAFELTIRRFYALVLGGVGANDILPLRIGDILRARWLATSAEITSGRALGSVFRDRACDVLTLVVALAVSLPSVGGAEWTARIIVGGLVLLAGIALLVVAAFVYARTRPRARRPTRGRARSLLRDTIDEVASPLARRRVLYALVLSAAAWTSFAVSAALVRRSLGLTLSPFELVFVTAVINLGVVIPSSPGFVGTYQWLAVSALGVVGVDGPVALAFALLMQAVWFIPTAIFGGAIAIREVHRDATRAQAAAEPRVPSPR